MCLNKPLRGVTLLLSGETDNGITDKLKILGADIIYTKRNEDIPRPVAYHVDMQYAFIGSKLFTLRGNLLPSQLSGLNITETIKKPRNEYPYDILCNSLVVGNRLFSNLKYTDVSILEYAAAVGIKAINVKQGYAACSTCVLNDSSIVTADTSIAAAAAGEGLNVLKITPGYIDLPGYDYGFIGGCSGNLGNGTILFTGSLDKHPDGNRIRVFANENNCSIIELTKNNLIDIGGIKKIEI